jgi:hypothetical protein
MTDPADRRARLLDLTRSGHRACEDMIAARCRAVEEPLRDRDDDEVNTFTELFREVNHAVEAHQKRLPSTHRSDREAARRAGVTAGNTGNISPEGETT